MSKVGKEGVTTVEEAKARTPPDIVEGMQFEKGDISPYLSRTPTRWKPSSTNP